MIATDRIYRQWDDEIVPRLVDYIRIPAKSPHFDPSWEAHGHIERVVELAEAWARAQPVTGLAVEVIRLPGRTPLLYFEAPGRSDRTVLLYGHLDKQPEMVGWRADAGPWSPVLENGRLYGRGGADDGYAIFAALSALGALDAQRLPRARCVGLIETCEESGSYDLPADRQGRSRRRTRFRLRRLRAAVDDDLAARTCGGNAQGRGADRRRSFGRRERRGAVVVSNRAQAGRAAGGFDERLDTAVGLPRADSRRARRAGGGGGGDPRRHRVSQVSVRRRNAPDVRRRRRGASEPHVAPGPFNDRRRRDAVD